MRTSAIVVGLAVTLTVHGVMLGFAVLHDPVSPARNASRGLGPKGSVGGGLCGLRRCPAKETRMRRHKPADDPVSEVEVLEAALIPALGRVKPDPTKLPKLQTYEQPEVTEDGVNLDDDVKELRELIKDFDKREEKRDPKNKKKPLDKRLEDFREDDPRKSATDLSKIIGSVDGEVGGQGLDIKAGNLYGAKVAGRLRRVFQVPPYLGIDTLKKLRLRVLIKRMNATGEILVYRVLSKSGNRAFDDAALAAVRHFVPREGGRKSLPRPEPNVLRFINNKGMKITLDGRLMSP